MSGRIWVLAAGAVLLSGCARHEMPEWWPESLGGPIVNGRFAEGPLEGEAHPGLEPLATLGRNGMRVSISPSFGLYDFVVDLIPEPHDCVMIENRGAADLSRPNGCGGLRLRYTVIGEEEAPEPRLRRFEFLTPGEESSDVIPQFNRLAQRWKGTTVEVLDGTEIAIEQFRHGRLRSMSSNVPISLEPDNPAAHLLPYVHRLLLAYGPAGAVPRNSSFTVVPADEDDYPCMAQSFATPDPDGFGAGDDACAREIASLPRR